VVPWGRRWQPSLADRGRPTRVRRGDPWWLDRGSGGRRAARNLAPVAEALHREVPRFVAATDVLGVQRLVRTAAIFRDPEHEESLRRFLACGHAVASAGRRFRVALRSYSASAASTRNRVCCHELLVAYGRLLVAVSDVAPRPGSDPPVTDRALTRSILRALRLLEATAPPGLEPGCPPPPHPDRCACGHH
jgi:hypothetical protein